MELGLSLGDATPPTTTTTTVAGATATTTTTTTTTVNKSLGFCMALGMNPLNGTSHQHKEKSHAQDDHDDDVDDDGESDDDDDDDDDDDKEQDDQIIKENEAVKDVTVSSQRLTSMNPPVQLDLLLSAPVHRHTSFPWSSDNGSSEGGSSGNVAAGKGCDGRGMVGTEEATSSFRLEFMSYDRVGSKNHKRGFEIGNDAVVAERVCCDEDEHGISRKKLRLSKEQSAYLEETFKEHNTLSPKQKLALAEQLNLRPRQVEVWFQNRRARTKLKQTEVDYEYLKRSCETLKDENRKLHKELQELRALKTTSNPYYMQLPATTLTMCPSCERVSTTSTAITPPPSTTTITNPVINTPLNIAPNQGH